MLEHRILFIISTKMIKDPRKKFKDYVRPRHWILQNIPRRH
jgi:hypothetical protein